LKKIRKISKVSKAKLNKKRWNELSKEVRLEKPNCEYCNTAPATQVHHVGCSKYSYESLLRFDKRNLLSCCGKCHFLFHKSPAITIRWFMNKRSEDFIYIIRKIEEKELKEY